MNLKIAFSFLKIQRFVSFPPIHSIFSFCLQTLVECNFLSTVICATKCRKRTFKAHTINPRAATIPNYTELSEVLLSQGWKDLHHIPRKQWSTWLCPMQELSLPWEGGLSLPGMPWWYVSVQLWGAILQNAEWKLYNSKLQEKLPNGSTSTDVS